MADGFTVLIMAAGRGTRMRSELPKVLHPVCGKPMVEWVIAAARAAGAERAVVVTRPGDGVADGLAEGVDVAEQAEGDGTGAAVLAARDRLEPEWPVVVLSADHPLLTAEDIRGLVETHESEGAVATILITDQLDPAGYGRIVRGEDGAVERIVETKYAEAVPAEVLEIREINLGTYAFRPAELLEALDRVELERGERYLTGVIPILNGAGGRIAAHLTHDAGGAFGVNDRAQLMEAESVAQRRLLDEHARAGVTFLSPGTTRVEAGVAIGEDTVVGPGCSFIGTTSVGRGARLGPHTTVIDSRIGDEVTAPHSYLLEAEVGDGASIGPFAYLRPDAVIGENAKVGTFVEVKTSNIERGAKVPHLSYIGDA